MMYIARVVKTKLKLAKRLETSIVYDGKGCFVKNCIHSNEYNIYNVDPICFHCIYNPKCYEIDEEYKGE